MFRIAVQTLNKTLQGMNVKTRLTWAKQGKDIQGNRKLKLKRFHYLGTIMINKLDNR